LNNRFGASLATAVVLAAVLGIEWLALPAGTLGVVLIGAVMGLAVIALLVRADWQRAGIYAACAACFTLTWNGWFVGPVRPGDALVLVALICFLVAAPNDAFRTPPWWVKQLGIVIILVAVLAILLPTDPGYLAQRVVLTATGQPTVSTKGTLAGANLGIAFKFVVAVVAIPMVFTAAAMVERRAVRWLAVSFAVGSSLSGAAAFLDREGLTSLGKLVTHIPNLHDREPGFSDHPNFLAAGLVLAIPFACWLLASHDRRDRLLGAACLPAALLGVYASGSRGGAVCAVVTVVISFALLPRTRPFLPGILLAGGVVAGAVAAFVPSIGAAVLRVTRLSGGVSTEGSDTVRAMVGAQGVRDFHHSPIKGVGLQVATEASQVYIQQLASGGLLLFGAMSVYMLGGMWASWKVIRRHDLGAALLGAFFATLGLNIFEADLTDRFYYVPAAILIALLYVDKRDDAAAADATAADATAADATAADAAAADAAAAVPPAAGPTVAAQR
jgi:hypothetical protein